VGAGVPQLRRPYESPPTQSLRSFWRLPLLRLTPGPIQGQVHSRFRNLALVLLAAPPLSAQVSVLMYQYDTSRDGANLSESVLTKANVTANQSGKLFEYQADGYIYGQPLYLSIG
jgi:hypothetical protein